MGISLYLMHLETFKQRPVCIITVNGWLMYCNSLQPCKDDSTLLLDLKMKNMFQKFLLCGNVTSGRLSVVMTVFFLFCRGTRTKVIWQSWEGQTKDSKRSF